MSETHHFPSKRGLRPTASMDYVNKKTRKERLRIELAPDQPLTTQGKPRARVYLACSQCRTRKTRCDGARPTCHNCTRRAKSSGPCEYDPAPKRRGPDRTPGARHRTAPEARQEILQRRRRKKPQPKQPILVPDPHVVSTSSLPLCSDSLAPDMFPALSDSPIRSSQGLYNLPSSSFNSDHHYPVTSLVTATTRTSNSSYRDHDTNSSEISLASEPSLQYTRQTWWDHLLSMYSSSSSKRQQAANQITNDLRFLFRHANYWLSFVNVPHFFSAYFDHGTRHCMQPSLLPAALAVATFFQSSEAGRGREGRRKALRLRDVAQGALEASLNARWIDQELAQAAWLLALFEVCAHPNHASERCSSGLVILDIILRALSLTLVDVDDPTSTRFSPRSVPSVMASQSWTTDLLFGPRIDDTISPHARRGCSCVSRSLAQQPAVAYECTPLWLTSPAWDHSWSESEVQKETCRRLCWSTLLLTAGHTSYVTSENRPFSELFVLEPANIALLFPGEAMRSPDDHSGKDTIWSLNLRTILLWNSCLRIRHDPNVSEADLTRFTLNAWLEADFLEQALDSHECDFERTFLFQGREYLFNVWFTLANEFRRYMPLTALDVNHLFRKKATAWLTHQANVAERIVQSLGAVTGHVSHTMIHRPFFAFWFMSQINRALFLWECDNSLTLALDVSTAFFKPVDYLSTLWPCSEQRRRSQIIREHLAAACRMAGRPLPPEDPSALIMGELRM